MVEQINTIFCNMQTDFSTSVAVVSDQPRACPDASSHPPGSKLAIDARRMHTILGVGQDLPLSPLALGC